MYNFSGTKAATTNAYINPGIYRLKVTEVKQDKFQKGTPFIGFKFEDEAGLSFIEKFTFGTDKSAEVSLSRLQYLHEGFFGKPCTKDFKTLEEITAYFSKWLTSKPLVKTIVVGGNKSGNTVFASLPYAGYFVEDDAELGEFEVGSKEYKRVVRESNSTSEVADKPNGLLNDADEEGPIGSGKPDAKSETKKPKTSASKEKEEDSNECPW